MDDAMPMAAEYALHVPQVDLRVMVERAGKPVAGPVIGNQPIDPVIANVDYGFRDMPHAGTPKTLVLQNSISGARPPARQGKQRD
ncbi:hypothetical protein [Shinella sp. BYT-45]|uniref:hypothetical protein n=1 Tax=Shinella sp. BYT-45 TaxID=3377377 RepID=UPI003980CD09